MFFTSNNRTNHRDLDDVKNDIERCDFDFKECMLEYTQHNAENQFDLFQKDVILECMQLDGTLSDIIITESVSANVKDAITNIKKIIEKIRKFIHEKCKYLREYLDSIFNKTTKASQSIEHEHDKKATNSNKTNSGKSNTEKNKMIEYNSNEKKTTPTSEVSNKSNNSEDKKQNAEALLKQYKETTEITTYNIDKEGIMNSVDLQQFFGTTCEGPQETNKFIDSLSGFRYKTQCSWFIDGDKYEKKKTTLDKWIGIYGIKNLQELKAYIQKFKFAISKIEKQYNDVISRAENEINQLENELKNPNITDDAIYSIVDKESIIKRIIDLSKTLMDDHLHYAKMFSIELTGIIAYFKFIEDL